MSMETEQQAIARLQAAGYEHEFVIEEDGTLRCPECSRVVEPEDVTIDETVRFEGASDPDDESVIFALSSGPCGHKGILVSAFGPEVSGGRAQVLRRLGR
jgi:hypothetical protein